MTVRVQREDFDPGQEIAALTAGNRSIGGLTIFVGLVREMAENRALSAMTLEHYPGMTERMLARIEADARERWPLEETLIIHRYGRLEPGDRIVLVARLQPTVAMDEDRKSTRLNSSHVAISYAVFCLKKKNKKRQR